MRNTVFFLVLAMFLASCATEPAVEEPTLPSKEEAKTAVLEKIEKAAKLWSSGNPLGYVEVSAKDVVWLDDLMAPEPVKGKEALQAYLGNFEGQIPAHEFELKYLAFQHYEDIVIVTYHYQGNTPEGPVGAPWKVSSVYRYVDGDWLTVHENWTKVKTEE